MRLKLHNQVYTLPKSLVHKDQGGSGATTAAETRAVLKAIHSTTLGQPRGPLKLDEHGRIPSSLFTNIKRFTISLDGPKTVRLNQPATFWITDLDNRVQYQVQSATGDISIKDGVITYTHRQGSKALFSVNGKQYSFNVV